MLLRFTLFFLLLLAATTQRNVAEDGYRLWLKYDRVTDEALRVQYQATAQFIVAEGQDVVLWTAAAEWWEQ